MLSSRRGLGLGICAVLIACGSRTGLFAEGASVDGPDAVDAGPDTGTPVTCRPGRFTFDLALTQLMFVLDRSQSMRFSIRGETGAPQREWRWTLLENALRSTITTFDQQIAMGAKFYPEPSPVGSPANIACRTDQGVAIAPARGNAGRILASFGEADPSGGTPTAEALQAAATYLTSNRSVARTIVLATDGAPNCNGALDRSTCVCTAATRNCRQPQGQYSCLDDARTVAVVRDIAEQKRIPVYVIGIGSTETPEFLRVLDDIAIAGGRARNATPRHYNVQSGAELTQALETIRDAVAKCTYLTPSSPTNPNGMQVEIGGRAIPRDQTKTNGWDWVDQAYGELAFFGQACTDAQSSPASVIGGVVSCD
jgi:hypothetical protein